MEIRNMYITHHMVDGFSIEVSGYPARRYIGYSQRDAESKYRKEFNLQHKHFEKYVIKH